ncbi:MAG: hypothetical protein WD895_07345 [Acidimicrobiia bacterium]
MSEPTPRQVLYAMVAGGFFVVVLTLTVGAGITGVVPSSWTFTMAVLWLILAVWAVLNWRQTVPVLLLAIGLFVFWALATVLIANS